MHWPVETNQLPLEPNQYQGADPNHLARPWPKQNHLPAQWSAPTDQVRRHRVPGNSPPIGRRTAIPRHWDEQEYRPPELERRWLDRDYPRRWAVDPSPEPNDPYTAQEPASQFRRHWMGCPNQFQSEPSSLSRHRPSRRELAETTDDSSRWSVDPSQRPRRRVRTSSQFQSPWASEPIPRSRQGPQYDAESPSPTHRRWASIPQRRLTTLPSVLTRPNTDGAFPRTRRWRADPSNPIHESESSQPPINFILPPQTVGYALHQPQMDYGATHQPPMDYGAIPHQSPMDYSSVLAQPSVDYGATPSHQTAFGWYPVPGNQQLDYGAMMNPLSMNYATPNVDYGMPPLQGMDRQGAASVPPNFMWGSDIPHYHPPSA